MDGPFESGEFDAATIGFGLRRLTPGEDFHHFGPIQGVHGVLVHIVAFLIWVAGGPLLIALARKARAIRTLEGRQ